MLTLALALTLAAAEAPRAAPAPQVAIVPLTAGEGVTEKVSASLTEVVSGQVRRVPGVRAITQQEIAALLSFEKQKALLACDQDSCMAELGGSMGVDRLVFGGVSKLGASWLVHLKQMDVKKARTLGQVDRRIKGDIDAVLDALPGMVAELFAGAPVPPAAAANAPQAVPAAGQATATATAAPAAAAVAPPPAPSKPLPPAWADEPYELGAAREKLQLASDGKGRWFAYAPFDRETFFYSADGKTFYAQRIRGYSAEGEQAFEYTFWEPRAPAPWQASFGVRDGKARVHCGEQPVALTVEPAAKAKKLLKSARFLKPRWRRMAHAIARDDLGTYYYVDRAREPEGSTDFRLYTGTKGKLRAYEVQDAILDPASELFLTEAGRLQFKRGERESVTWTAASGAAAALTAMEVEDQARAIYTTLGGYAGEALGTPCDGKF